jgi:mono/diheme cytochrome c family protein
MTRTVFRRAAAGATLPIGLAGLLVLASCAVQPGPMSFVREPSVSLTGYAGDPTGVPPELRGADEVGRGRYLALAADCAACHTADDGRPFAGGRAFATQFGTLYSPNITADMPTGIGRWSDGDFLKAMHEGIGRAGQRLYPVFPYPSYTYLSDADVLAIKAYLFSLPTVHRAPTANALRFPFDHRGLMTFWNLLYSANERFRPVPRRGPEWNRGAYLTEALAHCGDCHTPRNALAGLNNRRKFAGAETDGWRAYNISGDSRTGVGAWSDAQLAEYLSTGHAKGHGTATGPMGTVVDMSLSGLAASDIDAMVVYLRSVPARKSEGWRATRADPAPSSHARGMGASANIRGRQIFAAECASCHDWTGVGALTPYASLTGARTVNDPSATNVVRVLLAGARRASSNGTVFMPAFDRAYSDAEIAAAANYVTARFGSQGARITPEQVARLRRP